LKILLTVTIACALMCASGCIRTTQDSAGLERQPGVPPTQATADATSAADQPSQSDPQANGGLSLRAAAPYASGSTAVPQNVNPNPFVTAASQIQAPSGMTVPPPTSLTRSADGTMSGPHDLPPATTGWGTPAATYGSKPETPSRKPATKKTPK
jgi:hypothetical protein